jgi:hypothetical protein
MSRNAYLVHQHWYCNSFTLNMHIIWIGLGYLPWSPPYLLPPRVRAGLVLLFYFTMDYSMQLKWTLILKAGFSVYRTRHIEFDWGLFCLPNPDNLLSLSVFCVWNGAHSECDRSAGDVHSSEAPDPTVVKQNVRVCPIFKVVFPAGLMQLLTVRYLFYFTKIISHKEGGFVSSHIYHPIPISRLLYSSD